MRVALGATAEPDPRLAEHTVASGLERREVREPQPRAEAGASSGGSTGCSSSTTTCASRRASSTASCALRALRPRPRAARADAAQPLGLEGHSPPARCRSCARPASSRSGPLTAFGRRAAAELLPFPELRFGWGLDLHWAALAEQRGWRLGVVDALPVRHESQLVASGYAARRRRGGGRRLPRRRPYLPGARAGDTLAVHRRVRLMRLLFVCPDMRTGGAERHWATLIPRLPARGVEVGWSAWPERGRCSQTSSGPASRRCACTCVGAATRGPGAACSARRARGPTPSSRGASARCSPARRSPGALAPRTWSTSTRRSPRTASCSRCAATSACSPGSWRRAWSG